MPPAVDPHEHRLACIQGRGLDPDIKLKAVFALCMIRACRACKTGEYPAILRGSIGIREER